MNTFSLVAGHDQLQYNVVRLQRKDKVVIGWTGIALTNPLDSIARIAWNSQKLKSKQSQFKSFRTQVVPKSPPKKNCDKCHFFILNA